ncbi:MAG: NAD(P)-binding domain-containing protein [Verrucomicrobia bacterium]|nr:NAD(P)-binding domain-containing protein [Verrucomicrobiota bacterium]
MNKYDVIIAGAGPYGLAVGAHLSQVRGLESVIFGEPMSFWERNMPQGMCLRSNWTATQIADPVGKLTLEAFQLERNIQFQTPVPVSRFVEYGQWYQSKALPDLDRRKVISIAASGDHFIISLEDETAVLAKNVIVALGIGAFARRPIEFAAIPKELASHVSEHRDLSAFRGKNVLVLGSGQSALESAALMNEQGVQVEVCTHAGSIHWLGGWASKTLHQGLGKGVARMLYAPTDVGPAGLSQIAARPDLVRRFPRAFQDALRKRALRPAGARWLHKRMQDVNIMLNCGVISAKPIGDQINVKLSGGIEKTVDHVLLGTGYQVDISRYTLLSPKLLAGIERHHGYPKLRPGLRTSVPGLHMLGAPAAWSFGPLMNFVSGAGYASRCLVQHFSDRKKKR